MLKDISVVDFGYGLVSITITCQTLLILGLKRYSLKYMIAPMRKGPYGNFLRRRYNVIKM